VPIFPFRGSKSVAWLPSLNYQVWVLAIGRLLSQIGSGFTLVYAAIFFVNQVGLSATEVGVGVGSQAITGIVGRALGGSLSDSQFGRKRSLLLATAIGAVGCFLLAIANDFLVFILGNLLLGLGMGIYWPAAETLVADLSSPAQRNEAFAVNRLCDSLGLGIGIVLGGLLVKATGMYRSLFVIDGLSFLVMFAVVYWVITEIYQATATHSALNGWGRAFRDRRLLTFCVVNVMFTTYILQINSTLPLYFTNVVRVTETGGFDELTLSALFTWHLVACVIAQLPAARLLNRLSYAHALMISALLWCVGFGIVWLTGITSSGHLIWAVLALGVLGLATVTYTPAASAIAVGLAPESLRGVYLAANSQCWAIAYFIGPPLGGWALDQPVAVIQRFWLVMAGSVGIAIAILLILERMMPQSSKTYG
jgi:MFS family permease